MWQSYSEQIIPTYSYINLYHKIYRYILLTFKQSSFTCANTRKKEKKSYKINFTFLHNKEIYIIFKTCCIICFGFFYNFISFCSNNIYVYSKPHTKI